MVFMEKIRASRVFQSSMRVLQFLSAIISLGLFSSRLYKVYRLAQRASMSNGAVEGILAAATAYTLAVTLLQLCTKLGGPNKLRWLMVVLDLLFVGAFIAVAYLTNPNNGPSMPCYTSAMRDDPANEDDEFCHFPLGVFILAIVSTILHMLTATFHEVRDRRHRHKTHESQMDNHPQHKHRNGNGDDNDDGVY